jgi:hypothetical protein
MATIAYTNVPTGFTNTAVFQWSSSSWALNDVGDPVGLSPFGDRTVFVYSSSSGWTAGSFEIQGSLDGTNWFLLEDASGAGMTWTFTNINNGNKAEVVGPATLYIRPKCATALASGSGTITIQLFCKGFS